MDKGWRYAGQVAFYGLFVAGIGYFSAAPEYTYLAPDQAVIKLSLSHPGQPREPCRERTDAELARLAPNMRIARACARARSPVAIEFTVDGQVHYRAELTPAGLQRDGASTLYRRFSVSAGTYRVEARLKDHLEHADYNYTKQADVTFVPGRVFVVDFNARQGGFIFRQ